MKACGGVELQLHPFLISALDAGERSAYRPDRFASRRLGERFTLAGNWTLNFPARTLVTVLVKTKTGNSAVKHACVVGSDVTRFDAWLRRVGETWWLHCKGCFRRWKQHLPPKRRWLPNLTVAGFKDSYVNSLVKNFAFVKHWDCKGKGKAFP